MALRIVTVAHDAAYQAMIGGEEHAALVVRERAGHAFDPEVADVFSRNASDTLTTGHDTSTVWTSVLEAEPKPHLTLEADGARSGPRRPGRLRRPGLAVIGRALIGGCSIGRGRGDPHWNGTNGGQ